jgi:hypothetical protein
LEKQNKEQNNKNHGFNKRVIQKLLKAFWFNLSLNLLIKIGSLELKLRV